MISLLKLLSLISLLWFPLAILATRLNIVHWGLALKSLPLALLIALFVFVVGMLITFLKRKSDPKKSRGARRAAYLALVPIIILGFQAYKFRSVPPIHNISTDVQDPPQFHKVEAIRLQLTNSAEFNSLIYSTAELAEVQTAAYPNIQTRHLSEPLPTVFNKAKSIAESLGWQVVNADISSGIIEATDTSRLWGFTDDVIIRIRDLTKRRNDPPKVSLDLRSVSRVGKSDLGANAKRIEKFLSHFSKEEK